MKKPLIYLSMILLLAACQSNDKGYADEMPPLFPAPQSFPLKLEEGYKVNPVTGDSIEPLINSLGDTIITGRPIPAKGKVIDRTLMAKPKVIRAGKPRVVPAHTNVHKIPDDLTVIPVNKDSLRTFTPGVDYYSSFVLLNSAGDTIPTGVPITAKGIVVPCLQPKPVKARPMRFKDDASHDIQYLDIDQGMNSSFVLSILEDKSGNLWFGTGGGGVSKYDGERFFHYNEKEGLSNNWVSSMLEDKSGNLWFGTVGGGMTKYDGERFFHYKEEEGLSNRYVVKSIMEDKSGNLWFGTRAGGISKYDGENFIHYTTKEGLSNNNVSAILEDKRGDLWFGTISGVSKYDGESFTHYTEKEGLSNNDVISILEDKSGNLWFGTDGGGVTKYDGENFIHYTEKEGLFGKVVNSILEDKSGNIWFSTWGVGVSMYDGESFTRYTEKEGLCDMVHTILEDKSGNLWFGNRGYGVCKYDGNSFQQYTKNEGLSNNNVFSILEDKSGNLWFGTSGGGMSKYDGNSFQQYTKNEGLIHNRIWSTLEDKSGNFWFGTQGGASKFDGENFVHYTEKEGLYGGIVNSILEDHNGNLWFATWGAGAFKFVDSIFIQYTEEEGFSSNFVRSILEDKSGDLWFSTGRGVSKYDGESFIHYTEREGLSRNGPSALLEDKRGNLWFGTLGGGISILDGESFIYYTEKEGLSNNDVYSLLEDKNNNIWVGTGKGLNCFQMHGFEGENQENKLKNAAIVRFTTESGLEGTDFYRHAALLDSKNRAWWGTEKALNMLDLNNFNFSVHPPAARLSFLEIEGQFIDYRSLKDREKTKISFDSIPRFENYPLNLKLPFNQNHLTFHFSAIDWAAPHKIKYSYIIPGVDKQWSQPSYEAKADYRNLPNGTHTFIVRAIGESMEWSEPFEYTFTIIPPWRRSKAMIWGYFLFGCVIVWLVVRWRTRNLLKQKAALEQTVKERTIELKTQKEEAETRKKEAETQKERAELSEKYKEQFLANMSHEIRTPMHAILGMTNILARNEHPSHMDKYLSAIKQNSDNLLVILNDILDLSKIEAGKIDIESIPMRPSPVIENVVEVLRVKAEEKGLALHLSIDKEIPEYINGDPTRLTQILLNLLSNAIKFTEKGSVEITVNKEGDQLRFAIKDSGIGIPEDRLKSIFGSFEQVHQSANKQFGGTGLGLSISKLLVELQNGKIWVESKEKVGSTFFFELPLVPVETEKKVEAQVSEEELKTMAAELKGIKILLAEDNEFNVMIASDDLSYYIKDIKVEIAENGRIAIEEYKTRHYDLILMDIQLPELSGYDATKAIRELESQNGKEKPVPIIAMTASLMKSDLDKCYDAGMDNYIPKPYKIEELIGTIHKEVVTQN